MKQREMEMTDRSSERMLGARPAATMIGLLQAIAGAGRPLNLTEVSAASGVPKATAYRYLLTMAEHDFVARSAVDSTYTLGAGVLGLSYSFYAQNKGLTPAREAIPLLARDTGETAHLAVLTHDKVVYVDIAESDRRVRAYVTRGEQLPAYCTASGHAILAFSPPAVRDAVLSADMPRLTAATLTTRQDLAEFLLAVRRQGYSISRGQWIDEVIGISAPIFDGTGAPVAAIGVSVPMSRSTDQHVDDVARAVLAHAQRISEILGYKYGDADA